MKFTQTLDVARELTKKRRRTVCFRCLQPAGVSLVHRIRGCTACQAALPLAEHEKLDRARYQMHTERQRTFAQIRALVAEKREYPRLSAKGYAGFLHKLERDFVAKIDATMARVSAATPIRCWCCFDSERPGCPAFVETWDGSRFCPVCAPETLQRGFCAAHGRACYPEIVDSTGNSEAFEAAILAVNATKRPGRKNPVEDAGYEERVAVASALNAKADAALEERRARIRHERAAQEQREGIRLNPRS